jgi:hypothetical protein
MKLPRKLFERCEGGHSQHSLGTDVAAVSPVPRRRCGIGEASPGAEFVIPVLERIANLVPTPFTSEPFSRQEQQEVSA